MVTTTLAPPSEASPHPVPRPSVGLGIVVGLVSGAVAIGVAQLVAAIVDPDASPVVAVGGTAIDASPEWLKSFAIRTFGANDKTVLLTGIGVVLTAMAALIGVAAVRRPRVGYVGMAVFAAIGVAAAATRPTSHPIDVLPSIAGGIAGAIMLWTFLRVVDGQSSSDRAIPETPGDRPAALLPDRGGRCGRRGRGGGRGEGRCTALRGRRIPRGGPPPSPAAAPPGPPAGADLDVPGLSAFITPNDTFYRVDTALLVPAVKAEDWQLRVHGLVEREVTFTFDELMARPLIERDITLTCVSNPVGGEYIGNARWLGTPLAELLDGAGVQASSDQLVSRSIDGFTAGTPTAVVMDGRDAMLAIAMNGEPLPLEHGFPVRMVVPGLYGYVSATKWIVEIELTTFDAFDAYWIKRGWAQQAPIRPSPGSTRRGRARASRPAR